MERLAVSFSYMGKVWEQFEAGRSTGGVLADAQREAQQERLYGAMYAYVAGTVKALAAADGTVEEGRNRIREVCRQMPWVSAEQVALRTLLASGGHDSVEGIYACPRCGREVVSEGEEADRISELTIAEGALDETMPLKLAYPIEVKDNKGETVVSAASITFRRPSLSDCMAANVFFGLNDEVRLAYRINVESIEAVNGAAVDKKFRNTWGMYLFDRMDGDDLQTLAEWQASAGFQTRVMKRCRKCGKTWEVQLSTMGFFASGLTR